MLFIIIYFLKIFYNLMIKTIAHLADIHFSNKFSDHLKFNYIIEETYKSLLKTKPDLICIVGDLFHDYIDQENETTIIAGKFLNRLSEVAPIVISKGNHDLMKRNLKRINSIKLLVELLNNDKITFYDESGIYNYDENITFYVWDYGDRLNPYTLQSPDISNRITIDLYHNPINNCNMITKIANDSKYKNIGDFKSDYLFSGDIHLMQYLDKEKSKAYCGSLFQTNFGEYIQNHGYILWDIKNNNSELIEIYNPYNYITFETSLDFDYDNIKFYNNNITDKSQFRLIWNDYVSTSTKENEKKLREYFKIKFNTYIKLEKEFIHIDLINNIENKKINNINIYDSNVQKELFNEYLILNKFDIDVINKIFDIDDIITNRIDFQKIDSNVKWSIENITINNFKSYGDNNYLELSDKNGIIQLNGINKQGKTTLLDAICYVLYGTTISTNTKQKFGDMRYINNKRTLDYCEVKVVIKVNDELFTIIRKTELKYKKKGGIDTCSTNVNYYEGLDTSISLNEDLNRQTQEKLNSILGNFDNFIRLAFTNADNLNDSLSIDRSVFIDSLLRDLGLDIFEKKLMEFKKWEKEQNYEKINFDLKASNLLIEKKQNLIHDNNNIILINENKINENIILLNNNLTLKDEKLKKLNKIDEDVLNNDLKTIEDTLKTIDIDIDKINTLNNKIDYEYENIIIENNVEDLIIENNKNLKILLIDKNTNELKKKDLEKDITSIEIHIQNLKNEISTFKKDEIQKIRNTITDNISTIKTYENNILLLKNNEKNRLDNIINDINNDIKTINIDVSKYKKEAKLIKDEIDEIKKSGICSECKRPFDTDEEHIKILENTIDIKNNKIEDIFIEYKKINLDINKLNNKKEIIEDNIELFNNEDYSYNLTLKDNIDKQQNDIKDLKINNIKLKDNIEEINSDDYSNNKVLLELNNRYSKIIESENQKIEDINIIISKSDNKELSINIKELENELEILNEKTKLKNKKQDLLNEKNSNLLKISELKTDLTFNKSIYDKIILYEKYIIENNEINENIKNINNIINIINNDIEQLKEENINYNNSNVIYNNEISIIEDNIKKFNKQQKIEFINKTYASLNHRDGIPTFLLKKNLDIINYHLEKMLEDVDFILYFNENIELKMSSKNRIDVSQNAVESSGAERTFCSLALKMALHEINTTSKPDFILLDEIMGKLIENSIDEFRNFLNLIKDKIDKIIIIEHVHTIDFDHIITAKKDEYGVSTIELN